MISIRRKHLRAAFWVFIATFILSAAPIRAIFPGILPDDQSFLWNIVNIWLMLSVFAWVLSVPIILVSLINNINNWIENDPEKPLL